MPHGLHEHGYACIDSLLPVAQVDAIRSLFERTIESGSPNQRCWADDEIIGMANELPEVRQAIAACSDGGLFLNRAILFDKTSARNWRVAWHRDLTIAVRERTEVDGYGPWSVKDGVAHVQPPRQVLERCVTLRLHLDAHTPANGPLLVVPGSHADGAPIDPDRCEASCVECLTGVGGAVLMRPLILHASKKMTGEARRRVVHLEYASGSLAGGMAWARAGQSAN